MKEIDPVEVLERFTKRFKTQGAAAKELHISQPYLSDMLKGNRPISDNMLNRLGLRRIVVHTADKS
jgi:plasmid maintenance system antidote protein VapI